jgi:hypothetical protein
MSPSYWIPTVGPFLKTTTFLRSIEYFHIYKFQLMLKMPCPYRKNNELTGTAHYTSINAHLSVEQAHHNDLKSLTYILIYFGGSFCSAFS